MKDNFLQGMILPNLNNCLLELAEGKNDFSMLDDEFGQFVKYHMAICEKRELLGSSSYLLYVCKKI